MKIAVIKTGGKQYLVKEKDKLKVEKLAKEVGQTVELEVLMVADGEAVEIGEPTLKEKVTAKILRQLRSKKVTGVKYKAKSRQAKRFGHRQWLTEVEIGKI